MAHNKFVDKRKRVYQPVLVSRLNGNITETSGKVYENRDQAMEHYNEKVEQYYSREVVILNLVQDKNFSPVMGI